MQCKFSKTDSYSHCPNCGVGSEFIDWHNLEADTEPYYKATCKACGCYFHEVFEYKCTFWDEPVSHDKMTDEEVESLLNHKESGDSEEWPEFEVIKDSVTEFMADLPIEVYEHLLKATQQNQAELIEYLLAFPGKKEKSNTELVDVATEIVNDFDQWGEVLQADEDGEYTSGTAIERLRRALQ